jgi:hypothetical protein
MHRGTSSHPTPLKRQSCDRCHGQKLRCSKGGLPSKESDSCARCRRKGVSCEYSTPLPKGRPSTYRRAEADSPRFLHAPSQDGPRSSSCSLSSQTASSSTTVTAPVCDTNILPQQSTLPTSFSDPQLSIASLPEIASTWLSTDSANLFQGDQLKWDFPLVTPSSSDGWTGVADFPDECSLADPSTTLTVTDRAIVDSYHEGSVSHQFVPGSLTSTSPALFSASRYIPLMPHSLPSDPSSGPINQSNSLPSLWPPKEDSIEICIRQLSDLNVRLYPVYKASCSFAEAQKSHSGAVFSAATFHIMTTLLEESTPTQQKCTAISETFNASRSLLNIVHQLQATCASPKRIQVYTSNSQSQTPATSRTGLDSGRSESSDPSEPPGPSSLGSPVVMDSIAERGSHNLAIGYLILACYTRLLHIYHTLITALHYDACHAKGIESNPSPSLAQLRLILVVQLITHLLDGLRDAVAAYFSQVDDPLDPSVLLANQASLKTVSKLEVDIQDKIKQLNEVLRG